MRLLMLLSCLAVCSAPACELTPAQATKFLAQDFDTFDQSPDGWRSLYQTGGNCDLVIAQLIDSYHLSHQKTMEPWQDRLSYWHAGQSYAFLELRAIAVERLRNAFDPEENANPSFHWNAYARATIAFLEQDKAALMKAQSEFVTVNPAEASNFKIVQRFGRCFGATYFEAYTGSGGCP